MSNQLQISYLQFAIPNFQPAVPAHPSDPLSGCACGCGCGSCGQGPKGPQPPAKSGNSMRYATGEVVLQVADLKAEGYGVHWGHTRSFASQLTQSANVGNGTNWQVKEWTYLVVQDSGTVVVMGDANRALWFDPPLAPATCHASACGRACCWTSSTTSMSWWTSTAASRNTTPPPALSSAMPTRPATRWPSSPTSRTVTASARCSAAIPIAAATRRWSPISTAGRTRRHNTRS